MSGTPTRRSSTPTRHNSVTATPPVNPPASTPPPRGSVGSVAGATTTQPAERPAASAAPAANVYVTRASRRDDAGEQSIPSSHAAPASAFLKGHSNATSVLNHIHVELSSLSGNVSQWAHRRPQYVTDEQLQENFNELLVAADRIGQDIVVLSRIVTAASEEMLPGSAIAKKKTIAPTAPQQQGTRADHSATPPVEADDREPKSPPHAADSIVIIAARYGLTPSELRLRNPHLSDFADNDPLPKSTIVYLRNRLPNDPPTSSDTEGPTSKRLYSAADSPSRLRSRSRDRSRLDGRPPNDSEAAARASPNRRKVAPTARTHPAAAQYHSQRSSDAPYYDLPSDVTTPGEGDDAESPWVQRQPAGGRKIVTHLNDQPSKRPYEQRVRQQTYRTSMADGNSAPSDDDSYADDFGRHHLRQRDAAASRRVDEEGPRRSLAAERTHTASQNASASPLVAAFDTIRSIAGRFGASVVDLARMNEHVLHGFGYDDPLPVGLDLDIPVQRWIETTPSEPGDTLARIAADFGLRLDELAEVNPDVVLRVDGDVARGVIKPTGTTVVLPRATLAAEVVPELPSAPMPPAMPRQSQQQAPSVRVVATPVGRSLAAIAKDHGCSLKELAAVNGGRPLKIPMSNGTDSDVSSGFSEVYFDDVDPLDVLPRGTILRVPRIA